MMVIRVSGLGDAWDRSGALGDGAGQAARWKVLGLGSVSPTTDYLRRRQAPSKPKAERMAHSTIISRSDRDTRARP